MSVDPIRAFLEKHGIVPDTIWSMRECIKIWNMDTFGYLISIDKTLLINPNILDAAIRYNNLEVLKILAESQDLKNNPGKLHNYLILATIESNVEINKFLCQISSDLQFNIVELFCKSLIRDSLDLEVCKFYMSKIDEFRNDQKISFESISLYQFYDCIKHIETVKWVFSKYNYENNTGIYVDMLDLVQQRKVPEDVKAFVIQEIEPVIQKMDSELEAKEPVIENDTIQITIPSSLMYHQKMLLVEFYMNLLIGNPTENTIINVIDVIKKFDIDLNKEMMTNYLERESVYWFAVNAINLKIVERLLQVCPIDANNEDAFKKAADYPEYLALYEQYKQPK